ncbi:oxidoreductase UcpA [Leucosporidium creatinivorum]|uniref:Oxidoreductase UcpA n=1 Tax=Leucosporidium creatinivorum TaxID=106004 RepID=A0A1Y2G2R1_9BASI|nr:oxidoreductase UcpA [Leucosporidium creatinivorum]
MPISSATLALTLPGVALVTGGASGLGAGIVLAFADLGAKVVIADINLTGAEKLAETVNAAYPGRALAIRTDVTSISDIKLAVQKTVEHFGRLDYAINSAGLVVGGKTVTSIPETDEEAYDKIQAVDARGVFFCMKHELQVMLNQEPLSTSPRSSRGVIINMASRASLEGVPKFGAYCSAKHAVLGMTRVAAVEHAKDRIRVVAVCPGLITTPGHVKAAKEVDDMLLAKVPMSRFGTVDELIDAITWLCSDMASYVTGSAFEVDGGCAAI